MESRSSDYDSRSGSFSQVQLSVPYSSCSESHPPERSFPIKHNFQNETEPGLATARRAKEDCSLGCALTES
jgi:hypothetical protein